MKTLKVSKAFSSEGFDWKTLLRNNKDNFKLILSGLIGILTTQGWIEAGLAIVVVKLVLDSIDFIVSEVKLN